MNDRDLKKVVEYIAKQGTQAMHLFTTESDFALDYLAIFCKDNIEYAQLEAIVRTLGEETDKEKIKTGPTFLLQTPIESSAGTLSILKIRKPDSTRPQRGAPDFRVPDYHLFKKRYLGATGNFTLMPKADFEMIELKGTDVLVYIPSKSFIERSAQKL